MISLARCIIVSAAFVILAAHANDDVDPDNDGSQYAYGANLGWLNAEPLGDGGPGLQLEDDIALGWLWSANSGWISLSCQNTNSCATVDYGVTHDGKGNLAGYAWSPNIGWISFSCESTDSCNDVDYSVTVSLSSGEVSGFAYAANAGWIAMACEATQSCAEVDYGIRLDVPPRPDAVFQDRFED